MPSCRGAGVRLSVDLLLGPVLQAAAPATLIMPATQLTQENKIDYSARDKNPLDAVHFFDSLDASQKRKLRPDQISSMVVASYQV